MLRKSERTMDVYKKLGAEMRLLKNLGTTVAVEVSKVLSAKDTDKLLKALYTIDSVCSQTEDNMFSDHPELGGEAVDIFYGNLNEEPRNDTDREVIELARKYANELFR